MFDRRDDLEHLMQSLESFLRQWHGEPRAWYGIAPEKLAAVSLPEPLRRLYAFAGNWPGDNFWCSAFSYQDHLTAFEMLAIEDDKLVFAWENQGVWRCGTEREGRNPAVWIREGDRPWEWLGESLSPFLVTLCLQETVFGARYQAPRASATEYCRSQGRHVAPLWLDAPWPLGPQSIHLVDGRLLVLADRWCGTNDEDVALSLPELFTTSAMSRPEPQTESFWENPEIPAFLRKRHWDNLSRQYDEQAAFHSQRATSYRRMANKIK